MLERTMPADEAVTHQHPSMIDPKRQKRGTGNRLPASGVIQLQLIQRQMLFLRREERIHRGFRSLCARAGSIGWTLRAAPVVLCCIH